MFNCELTVRDGLLYVLYEPNSLFDLEFIALKGILLDFGKARMGYIDKSEWDENKLNALTKLYEKYFGVVDDKPGPSYSEIQLKIDYQEEFSCFGYPLINNYKAANDAIELIKEEKHFILNIKNVPVNVYNVWASCVESKIINE